jgi:hypothetical protein
MCQISSGQDYNPHVLMVSNILKRKRIGDGDYILPDLLQEKGALIV